MIFKPVFSRYVLSGLILNGLSFVTYVVLLQYLHFSPIMSVSIIYPIIICIYYLVQTYFVFNKNANFKNFVQFLFYIICLYFLNVFVLSIFTKILYINATMSQFLITISLIFLNYFIQQRIFK